MTASEIARRLGAASRSGRWWRCRCPAHGSRGATLALRDGERGLIVYCHAGCSRDDILAELKRGGLLGGRPTIRPPVTSRPDADRDESRRIAAAHRTWDAARDARGTPVAAYLANRGIIAAVPPVLCYAPRLRRLDGSFGPAMVARVDAADGRLVGVHRTWLNRRADGAWRRRDRALLGRAAGGAVRLASAAETLLVGEGIETCLAAMQATAQPAWAALSTSGMAALILPPVVCTVVILADHDISGAGERAAWAAAARWLGEGRQVRIALPPEPGTDMADVLAGRGCARIIGADDAAA